MNALPDPSLSPNYSQIFQVQKQFVLTNELRSFEDTFMARIFKSPSTYKIQLTSQNNVSFLYKCEVDYRKCTQIANANSLQLTFANFFEWIKSIFNGQDIYQFNIQSKTNGELKVFKNDKFKLYQLANLPFDLAEDDEVHQNLSYRYQRMKQRKQLLIDYWGRMTHIIKTKNPTLLSNLDPDRKVKKNFK